MERSESITNLAKALAGAQSDMRVASFDSTNPHFRNKYASLSSVWSACREPLTKHGLSVSQLPRVDGSKLVLTTMLMHESGEFIAEEMALDPGKPGPQPLGSALTYARRYALASVVGIVSDEDDDAELATAPRAVAAPRQPTGSSMLAAVVAAFVPLGIKKDDLETLQGKTLKEFGDDDFAFLRSVHQSIMQKKTTVDELKKEIAERKEAKN